MLARKLTVILLVVVSLAATTFGILWTREVLEALERRKIARLNTLALATRIAVENGLKTGNVSDLRRLVERLEKSREISVFLLDRDGRPMVQPLRPVPPLIAQTAVSSRPRSVWLTPGKRRVRVHPVVGADGQPVGKLAVAQDWAPFLERQRMETWRIAEFVMALAVVTGVAVWLAVRHLVDEPLQRLSTAVQAISDGRRGPASRVADARRDEIGALGRALNDMQDALGRAEDELRDEVDTKLRLERSLHAAERHAAVGRIAGALAHETGTALNVIQGRAELLDESLDGDRATRAELGVIIQQCRRISRTIRGLLDYSRPQLPQLERVDLNAVVGDVVEFLAPAVRHLDVRLRLAEVPIAVQVDRRRIEDVLVNLVMNAAQAMPGGGALEIRTDEDERSPTGRSGRFAVVSVADEGPGIAPEHVGRIFEPFFTTKESGEGTGLGLAICWETVADHDGEIDVDSAVGRGTSLRVFLPQETFGQG